MWKGIRMWAASDAEHKLKDDFDFIVCVVMLLKQKKKRKKKKKKLGFCCRLHSNS